MLIFPIQCLETEMLYFQIYIFFYTKAAQLLYKQAAYKNKLHVHKVPMHPSFLIASIHEAFKIYLQIHKAAIMLGL